MNCCFRVWDAEASDRVEGFPLSQSQNFTKLTRTCQANAVQNSVKITTKIKPQKLSIENFWGLFLYKKSVSNSPK